MKDLMKLTAETVTLYPKTVVMIPLLTMIDWITNNLDGILSTLTKLGSLVLIITVIRLHNVTRKKVQLEIDEKNKEKDS